MGSRGGSMHGWKYAWAPASPSATRPGSDLSARWVASHATCVTLSRTHPMIPQHIADISLILSAALSLAGARHPRGR